MHGVVVCTLSWLVTFSFRLLYYVYFLVRLKEHPYSGNMEDRDETKRTWVVISSSERSSCTD